MTEKRTARPEPYSSTWNYEIALYRGDEIIDTRTIKQIAERRGVRKDTIRWYLTGVVNAVLTLGKTKPDP